MDGDGRVDLVFQHSGNGMLTAWLMDGTNLVSGRMMESSQSLSSAWRVQGIADLNQDTQLDLMVQTGDGSLSALFLNGTLLLEQVSFDPLQTAAAWHLVGA